MSLFQNILIPTDFSGAAWRAVQIGMDLAQDDRSNITLLHVFPYSAKFDHKKGDLNDRDLMAIESIKKQMEEFCADLEKKTKAKVVSVILAGPVESEILGFLAEKGFDLIVMGVNSNGLDNHPGSHVASIIEKASAPVLIVPNKIETQNVPA